MGTNAHTYFSVGFSTRQSQPLPPLLPGSLLRALLPEGVALVPSPLQSTVCLLEVLRRVAGAFSPAVLITSAPHVSSG